jgi:hypothetical protein
LVKHTSNRLKFKGLKPATTELGENFEKVSVPLISGGTEVGQTYKQQS